MEANSKRVAIGQVLYWTAASVDSNGTCRKMQLMNVGVVQGLTCYGVKSGIPDAQRWEQAA